MSESSVRQCVSNFQDQFFCFRLNFASPEQTVEYIRYVPSEYRSETGGHIHLNIYAIANYDTCDRALDSFSHNDRRTSVIAPPIASSASLKTLIHSMAASESASLQLGCT